MAGEVVHESYKCNIRHPQLSGGRTATNCRLTLRWSDKQVIRNRCPALSTNPNTLPNFFINHSTIQRATPIRPMPCITSRWLALIPDSPVPIPWIAHDPRSTCRHNSLISLYSPYPGAQCPRCAVNLWCNRLDHRPLRFMLLLLLEYQPYRSFSYFRWITDSIFHRFFLPNHFISRILGAIHTPKRHHLPGLIVFLIESVSRYATPR